MPAKQHINHLNANPTNICDIWMCVCVWHQKCILWQYSFYDVPNCRWSTMWYFYFTVRRRYRISAVVWCRTCFIDCLNILWGYWKFKGFSGILFYQFACKVELSIFLKISSVEHSFEPCHGSHFNDIVIFRKCQFLIWYLCEPTFYENNDASSEMLLNKCATGNKSISF